MSPRSRYYATPNKRVDVGIPEASPPHAASLPIPSFGAVKQSSSFRSTSSEAEETIKRLLRIHWSRESLEYLFTWQNSSRSRETVLSTMFKTGWFHQTRTIISKTTVSSSWWYTELHQYEITIHSQAIVTNVPSLFVPPYLFITPFPVRYMVIISLFAIFDGVFVTVNCNIPPMPLVIPLPIITLEIYRIDNQQVHSNMQPSDYGTTYLRLIW